jgi:hypothetical protein
MSGGPQHTFEIDKVRREHDLSLYSRTYEGR